MLTSEQSKWKNTHCKSDTKHTRTYTLITSPCLYMSGPPDRQRGARSELQAIIPCAKAVTAETWEPWVEGGKRWREYRWTGGISRSRESDFRTNGGEGKTDEREGERGIEWLNLDDTPPFGFVFLDFYQSFSPPSLLRVSLPPDLFHFSPSLCHRFMLSWERWHHIRHSV